MKLTIPAMSFLQPEDLRKSRIPDKYVSSITTLIISDALPTGEYFVSHSLREKEPQVKAGLLEEPYDEEQEISNIKLSEMVHNVAAKYFRDVFRKAEQNSYYELILSRRPTQIDVADLISGYNRSKLVAQSSSSLSLCYDAFDSEREIEQTLLDSGISIRKIDALKEEGGTPEARPWNGIEIQLYQGCGARFGEGLEAIRGKGFERYLHPQEAFELLIGIREKRVDNKLQELFDCSGYEWLSLAWEVQGDILIAYLDPAGLRWQEPKGESYKYHTPEFTAKETRKFSLSKLQRKNERRYLLSEFNDDFVQFHFSRSFADLPEWMKNSVKIDLPPENFLVPVAHSPSNLIFGHLGCNGSPRGVRNK